MTEQHRAAFESYLKNSYIEHRDNDANQALFYIHENGRVEARLDGYAVIPKEKFEALRRLAAPDQEPYGWLIDRKIEPVFFTRSEIAADEYAGRGVNTTPVYLSPPPAADAPDHGGADAGVGKILEAALKELKSHGADYHHRTDPAVIAKIEAALSHQPAPVAANSSAKSSIVTCCVTGAIPGDGGACGDCDPCIMGEPLVPEAVKRLIAEKNSIIERNAELEEAANASAEARLRDQLCIVLSALRMHEEATGESFDDEGGDVANIEIEHNAQHPHASDCDKQKECCDLAAKKPCADCPFPNPDVAMRGFTDLERTLLIAARTAHNYIANTESELGMTLKSGDLLRAAIAKAEACEISAHHHASDCDKQGER